VVTSGMIRRREGRARTATDHVLRSYVMEDGAIRTINKIRVKVEKEGRKGKTEGFQHIWKAGNVIKWVFAFNPHSNLPGKMRGVTASKTGSEVPDSAFLQRGATSGNLSRSIS